MVKTEEAVIAKFEKAGEKFELLVDPELAMDLKNGKDVNFNDLLAIDTVFKDARKGDEKPEDKVKQFFGTQDINAIARKIILEGEVQLTTSQRKEMVEKRRAEIVAFISRNALNPQTNSPHPALRISAAMDEAKIHVDLSKPLKEQIPEVVKELKRLLPISFEKLKIALKFPAEFAGKAQGLVRKYDLKKEEWLRDGSYAVMVEIPAGLKNDLFNEVNHLTKGSVETKIVE